MCLTKEWENVNKKKNDTLTIFFFTKFDKL